MIKVIITAILGLVAFCVVCVVLFVLFLAVTGDGDFYCLINYLNKQNKLLRLLVPNVYKYSKFLKPFAPNKLDFMNNLRQKLEYK